MHICKHGYRCVYIYIYHVHIYARFLGEQIHIRQIPLSRETASATLTSVSYLTCVVMYMYVYYVFKVSGYTYVHTYIHSFVYLCNDRSLLTLLPFCCQVSRQKESARLVRYGSFPKSGTSRREPWTRPELLLWGSNSPK